MFELSVGDVLTTNCVKLDGTHVTAISGTTDTSVESIVSSTTGSVVYGGIDTSGYIMLDTVKPVAGPVMKVVAQNTLPNGEWAVKLAVVKA